MFLSFIVPVYNTEQYLEECLESLLEQDLPSEEYEIICVNDGSTDGSLNILKNYKQKYRNIIVIDKENGGVATTRNVGLDSARGDYVWFVDSDDLIQSNILCELREIAVSKNTERVSFGCYAFLNKLTDEEIANYNKKNLTANHFTGNIYVWNSIFKKSFLDEHSLRFVEELYVSEDSMFMIEVNSHVHKYFSFEKALYLHRWNATSLCSENTVTAQMKKLFSYMKVVEYLDSKYDWLCIDKDVYAERKSVLEEGSFTPLSEIADLLMSNLWQACYIITQLPREKRIEQLKILKEKSLFPYIRPQECTLKKSYQTNRKDFVGRIFDYIYIHMHTRAGFFFMVCWQRLYRMKKGAIL